MRNHFHALFLLWLWLAAATVRAAVPGLVVSWGDNSFGQTNVPAGLNNATAIAAGYGHTVALKSTGTMMAWGYNGNGQANVPIGLSNVTAVAAGSSHTVVLKN